MEENLDQMPLAELGSLPDNAVPAGMLTAIWSRRVSLVQQRNAEELVREQDPNYTGPRFLTAGNASAAHQRQQHEKFIRDYEQAMDDIRTRSNALLEQIEEREQQDREHLRQIEQNAIHLRDGRAVYVDHDQYRDERGNVLTGAAATEADQLHKQKLDASTWAQKDVAQHRYDEDEKLRQRVKKLHDDSKGDDGESLTEEQRQAKTKDAQNQISEAEKEFDQQTEQSAAERSPTDKVTDDTYGADDYMAAYARPTSYASTLDGQKTASLRTDFKPAAKGNEVSDGTTKNSAKPAASAPPSAKPQQ
jgi:hypothetical protein